MKMKKKTNGWWGVFGGVFICGIKSQRTVKKRRSTVLYLSFLSHLVCLLTTIYFISTLNLAIITQKQQLFAQYR